MLEDTNHEQKPKQESPAELLAAVTSAVEDRLNDERYRPFIKQVTKRDGSVVTELSTGDLTPKLRRYAHPEKGTRYETDIYYETPDENVIRSWKGDGEDVNTFSPNPGSSVERRTEQMDDTLRYLLSSDLALVDQSLTAALRSQETVVDTTGSSVPEVLGGVAIHTNINPS